LKLIETKAGELHRQLVGGGVLPAAIPIPLIITIIVQIVQLIAACRQLNRVREPGFFDRMRLRGIVRRACLGKNVNEKLIFDSLLKLGSSVTESEVMEAIAEVGVSQSDTSSIQE
jgi:hypothetical protein